MTVTLGDKIADFTALATDKDGRTKDAEGSVRSFQLSKRTQKRLVLYFYPKDSTPGCTNQAIDFRDQYSAFLKADCEVIGVSRDSLKSHDNFRAKHQLPFALLSDPEEALCAQFDVMKMKNMYGKQVRGIERSTFVVDAQGHLAGQWRGVKVAGHVAEVLAFVESLG
jgi:thioredoxin-dependent peroxiredoxin